MDEAVGDSAALGRKVGPMTFIDTWFLPRGLSDFGERKAFVLVFTTLECPVAGRYMPVLASMEREYRERGVQFVAINVGPEDTIVEVAARAVESGLEFPVVKDFTGETVQAVGATRTPEVVILDADHVLRYRGRIDDEYRLGGVRQSATQQPLREGLEDVLAGREVRTPSTRVEGCLITTHSIEANPELSWSEHIEPIVRDRCQICHYEGGEAPFALESYRDLRKRMRMVDEVVEHGRMPPWFAADRGEIVNDQRLLPEEREAILGWVRAGAPPGPEVEKQAEENKRGRWMIEPDQIIRAAQPTRIPASGAQDYQQVRLPFVFEEDTWVDGVQLLPSNPSILHHAEIYGVDKDSTAEDDVRRGTYIYVHVPGGDPFECKPGTAILIRKGSVLGLQLHYTPSGSPEEDLVSVGLRFPKSGVRQRLQTIALRDHEFEIPAYAPAFPITDTRTMPFLVTAYSVTPHMHLRGRDLTLSATYPNGVEETLLLVPNFSFDWQREYRWPEGGRQLPAGTRLEVVSHFDNSDFNPYNPDATVPVSWGRNTWDEMMYCWISFTRDRLTLNISTDPETGHVIE